MLLKVKKAKVLTEVFFFRNIFFCRDFPFELDPTLYGDDLYNPFTRECSSALEDLFEMGGIAMTDEDIDSGVLFGTLRGTVVGLRYYKGVVSMRNGGTEKKNEKQKHCF